MRYGADMSTDRGKVIATMALGCAVYAALQDWQTAATMAAVGIFVAWTYVSDSRQKVKSSPQ